MKQKKRIAALVFSTMAFLCYGGSFISINMDTIRSMLGLDDGFVGGLISQFLPDVKMHLSGWNLISAAGLMGSIPDFDMSIKIRFFLFWIWNCLALILLITSVVSNLIFDDARGRVTMVCGGTASLIHAGILGVFSVAVMGKMSPLILILAVTALIMLVTQELLKQEDHRKISAGAVIAVSVFLVIFSFIGIWKVYPSASSVLFYLFLVAMAVSISVWEVLVLLNRAHVSLKIKAGLAMLPVFLFLFSLSALLFTVRWLGWGVFGVMIFALSVVAAGLLKALEVPAEIPLPQQEHSCYSGRIIGLSGIYEGAVIDLEDGKSLSIGSDSDSAQLIIDEERISPLHIVIHYDTRNDIYEVYDSSQYGTYLESGKRIMTNQGVRLPHNTIICLGDTANRFRLN